MTAWLDLVKKTMKENKGKKFKEILQIAKKNYKPNCKKSVKSSRRGGRKSRKQRGGQFPEDETPAEPTKDAETPVSEEKTEPDASVEDKPIEVETIGGRRRNKKGGRKSRKSRR
jgi:hypothetical protein